MPEAHRPGLHAFGLKVDQDQARFRPVGDAHIFESPATIEPAGKHRQAEASGASLPWRAVVGGPAVRQTGLAQTAMKETQLAALREGRHDLMGCFHPADQPRAFLLRGPDCTCTQACTIQAEHLQLLANRVQRLFLTRGAVGRDLRHAESATPPTGHPPRKGPPLAKLFTLRRAFGAQNRLQAGRAFTQTWLYGRGLSTLNPLHNPIYNRYL